ncbi:hypothetical protein [Silvimonas amylolytica]|uniref:Uncharacterized protein n=1 Tax=Silvimonas amylolytica TaxID=449663 RepID=A0ABQ2PPY8_9NEIS|nr:hypothetical protein [Silvimonas amylolytica]GGP27052.1 hypothetical protein GCM10010971_28710 [Silvimonas amylolytica]
MNSMHELPSIVAAKWLEESLKPGPSLTLAKKAAERLDLQSWEYRTLANSALTSHELLDFSAGGKTSGLMADEWLFNELLEKERESKNLGLIIEDWREKRGNAFIYE